jgi:Ca2+-transporting ATPase
LADRAESGVAAVAGEAERTDWHAATPDAVIARLQADPAHGLRQDEVTRRLVRYGPNVLRTVGRARWHTVLARQFADALIAILLVAAAISFAVGETGDAVTILAIVILNGALGFVQEWRAEKASEALQRLLSPRCMVIRDGHDREIDSRDVVPGDLVRLEIGDQVPADLRFIEAVNVKADESALTGESDSVAKQVSQVADSTPLPARGSMGWMGTVITNGRGVGIVVATGMATEFGRIAGLTQSVGREVTPLQRRLGVLGRQLGLLAVGVSVFVVVAGLALGKSALQMFFVGVSLAVAVVPEGLPAVVTITLALGIRAMVRRRALIRRLQAAETLGAASVICTDKTGTLTQNEMTVTRIWLPDKTVTVTGIGYDPAGHFEADDEKLDYRGREDLLDLLRTGLICNHARVVQEDGAWNEFGEPTEAALVVAAYKAWLPPELGAGTLSEFSFNSVRKRMTVVAREEGRLVAYVKGAPEVILERTTAIRGNAGERPFTDADRASAVAAYTGMAERGLRTLALARRTLPDGIAMEEDAIEGELTLLGIVGIIDPPRPEVPAAMRLARQAGIRVLMITGDAAGTAMAIARRIDLPATRAVTGADIEALDDPALRALLDEDVILARTMPEQKMRVIRLLQGGGQVVAMTGDGVNDAPALRQADIGIAMGRRGTDVAKAAADMLLMDDNFASIVAAVGEGRRQFENIKRFVRYLLSSNAGEVVAILGGILLGGPLVLLPVQILWMNLVTDGVTALALGVERADRRIMERPPRRPDEPMVDRGAVVMVAVLGVYIGLATLWLFQRSLDLGDGSPEHIAFAQTVAFTGIVVLEKINVFNFRNLHGPITETGVFSNPWLLAAVAGMTLLQLAAVYTPFLQNTLHTVAIGWWDWLVIILAALPVFVVPELYKRWRFRIQAPRNRA